MRQPDSWLRAGGPRLQLPVSQHLPLGLPGQPGRFRRLRVGHTQGAQLQPQGGKDVPPSPRRGARVSHSKRACTLQTHGGGRSDKRASRTHCVGGVQRSAALCLGRHQPALQNEKQTDFTVRVTRDHKLQRCNVFMESDVSAFSAHSPSSGTCRGVQQPASVPAAATCSWTDSALPGCGRAADFTGQSVTRDRHCVAPGSASLPHPPPRKLAGKTRGLKCYQLILKIPLPSALTRP